MNRTPSAIAALGVAVVVAALIVLGAVESNERAYAVNGRDVPRRAVDEELGVLAQYPLFAGGLIGEEPPASRGSVDNRITSSWLTIRVTADAAAQELARRGERVTPADRATTGVEAATDFAELPGPFRRALVERLATVGALQRVLREQAGPDVLEIARATCPSGRFVSHILVATADDATSILGRLAQGEDFATVARDRSLDRTFGPSGGELGCQDGLSGDTALLAPVAQALALGVVSEPVATDFGFHLVVVTDRPDSLTLDQFVVEELVQIMRDARVVVDPFYGRWDRDTVRVVDRVEARS